MADELLVDDADDKKRTTAPHALSTIKPFHDVYDKGTLLAEVELRYHKSSEDHLVLYHHVSKRAGVTVPPRRSSSYFLTAQLVVQKGKWSTFYK